MKKTFSREQMMAYLSKRNFDMVHTTEDFDGSRNGIWVSGESDSPIYKGYRVYDYYAYGKNYELGVFTKWEERLNQLGWYSQWYDCGTMFIYPINF